MIKHSNSKLKNNFCLLKKWCLCLELMTRGLQATSYFRGFQEKDPLERERLMIYSSYPRVSEEHQSLTLCKGPKPGKGHKAEATKPQAERHLGTNSLARTQQTRRTFHITPSRTLITQTCLRGLLGTFSPRTLRMRNQSTTKCYKTTARILGPRPIRCRTFSSRAYRPLESMYSHQTTYLHIKQLRAKRAIKQAILIK